MIEVCYPGYTKKAISFTIDDGNLAMDKKMMDIIKPYGIKGTFNISPPLRDTHEFYREFYSGYGIANHCRWHPHALKDGVSYSIKEQGIAGDAKPCEEELYPTDKEGFYAFMTERGVRYVSDDECYIRFTEQAQAELEEVFGKDAVKGFVWPFGEQKNARIKGYLSERFSSVRKTGDTRDSFGFSVPCKRSEWSYNAHHKTLLEVMELYENYPDEGELKCFIFGVHSVDFETSDNWDDLRVFAEKYGNRPNDYWYATVDEIFDYKDASDALVFKEGRVENLGDIPIYLIVNGERTVLRGGETLVY